MWLHFELLAEKTFSCIFSGILGRAWRLRLVACPVELSDEKKLFFDWLKMNAIWAKREMIELVKPVYKDLRDVNKFVRSILRSRTYVRRSGDLLYVSFPLQRSKKSAMALEQLCEALNEYDNIDLGLSFRKITFSVREKH